MKVSGDLSAESSLPPCIILYAMFDSNITPQKFEEYRQQMADCREWLLQYDQHQHTVAQLTGALDLYINAHLTYFTNWPDVPKAKQIKVIKVEEKLNAEFFRRTRDCRVGLAAASDKLAFIRSEIARYDHAFVYYLDGIYFNQLPNSESFIEVIISPVIGMLKENNGPYFDQILDDQYNFTDPPFGEGLFYFFADVMFLGWLRRMEMEWLSWMKNTITGEQTPSTKPVRGKGEPIVVETFEQLFWEPKDAEITIRVMKRLRLLRENEDFIDVKNNKTVLRLLLDYIGKRGLGKLQPVSDKLMCEILGKRFNFYISDRSLRDAPTDNERKLSEISQYWKEESVKVTSK